MVFGIFFVLTMDIPSSLSGSKKSNEIEKPRALVIDISGPIVEKRRNIAPLNLASFNMFSQRPVEENLLFEIVDQIRAAAKDTKINGIILDLNEMPSTSLTKLRYIAKALKEFKETGKKIVASSGFYTQSQYYLASFADKIYMAKDGAVLLQGYGTYTLYYKDLLEKLEINAHVFRVGEYKSAVEPYIRNNMSIQAREANQVWLDQLWSAYVEDVSKNRSIDRKFISPSAEQMISYMEEVKGNTALMAKNLGLVDELLTRQEVRLKFAEFFGSNGKDSTNAISIYDYYPTEMYSPEDNRIAVLVASGVIVDGEDGDQRIGADTTAGLLRQARLNENVKAVVLRIDSPGGSAFASEVIRDEVEALKKAGKPVVASMSSVAASGGYWIASSANKIIAQPTTITGSIGIFGLLTTFDKTLAKYGVYNDGVGTTPFAGVGVTRALPESISQIMQLGIENGYLRFIDLVSTQRDIPLATMNKIAQGRVWTGLDAQSHKLVDQLGDFDDAIKVAAELAKIEKYEVKWLEKQLNPAQKLIMGFFSQAKSILGFENQTHLPKPLETLATQTINEIEQLSQFNDPKGHYVLCSECQM